MVPKVIAEQKILPGHIDSPLVKAIGRNVHITCHLDDMYAVLKVLLFKYPKLFFKYTSDLEIKDVHVGSMARSAKSTDYAGNDIYNNIRDLIDPPHLLIVQLGVLGTRNKAAPSALMEVLRYRSDQRKPVWAVSTVSERFGRGFPSWSEYVEAELKRFSSYQMPAISPQGETQSGPDLEEQMATGSTSFVAPDLMSPRPVRQEEEAPKKQKWSPSGKVKREEPEEDTGALGIYGSGIGASKKRRKMEN